MGKAYSTGVDGDAGNEAGSTVGTALSTADRNAVGSNTASSTACSTDDGNDPGTAIEIPLNDAAGKTSNDVLTAGNDLVTATGTAYSNDPGHVVASTSCLNNSFQLVLLGLVLLT